MLETTTFSRLRFVLFCVVLFFSFSSDVQDAPAAIVEELHSDVQIVGCSGGISG